MALTDTDRRRFFLATTLTLLALPALWWINQSENSAAPNVAVAGVGVGVDVGADHGAATDPAPAAEITEATGLADATPTTVAATPAPVAVPTTAPAEIEGRSAPVYLDGPRATIGASRPEIAVPASPEIARITTTATFRSSVPNGTCRIPGLLNGRTVTIVNLDTGRSITCVTAVAPGELADQIILSTALFAELADLTDAPIPVEIRQ